MICVKNVLARNSFEVIGDMDKTVDMFMDSDHSYWINLVDFCKLLDSCVYNSELSGNFELEELTKLSNRLWELSERLEFEADQNSWPAVKKHIDYLENELRNVQEQLNMIKRDIKR